LPEFVGDERHEMRALFYHSLRVIEHGLSARREYAMKDGTLIQGEPTCHEY
jgi:hypothetical protein